MARLRHRLFLYGQLLRLRALHWFFGGETYICCGCGALVRADLHPSSRCGLKLTNHHGWITHFQEREEGVAKELKQIQEKVNPPVPVEAPIYRGGPFPNPRAG